MAIESTIERRDSILVVEARGCDEGLEEVVEYHDAIREKAEEFNCNRILCDERKLEYRLSIADTYKLGEYISRRMAGLFAKIAVVTSETNQESAQFWENVTSNRGVVVRVFYDTEEAREWLL
jgi:hypothetical protein